MSTEKVSLQRVQVAEGKVTDTAGVALEPSVTLIVSYQVTPRLSVVVAHPTPMQSHRAAYRHADLC